MKQIVRSGFLVLMGVLILQMGVFANGFMDIENGYWAEEAVLEMQARGVINGYTDGTFRAENPVTRAEFVAMVNRLFGFTEIGESSFKDVPKGNWAYEEVAIAVHRGYIKGLPDGTFMPKNHVTRAEVAVMLSRIYEFENETESFEINDLESIPTWAREAVIQMVSGGVMTVDEAGLFNPRLPMDRVGTAVVLHTIDRIWNEDVIANMGEGEHKSDEAPLTGGGTPPAGSVSSPLTDPEIIESIDNVVYALEVRVLSRSNTDRQKQVTRLIVGAMKGYKADTRNDIEADMTQARTIRRQMTEQEFDDYEKLIIGYVSSYHLDRLNTLFKIR